MTIYALSDNYCSQSITDLFLSCLTEVQFQLENGTGTGSDFDLSGVKLEQFKQFSWAGLIYIVERMVRAGSLKVKLTKADAVQSPLNGFKPFISLDSKQLLSEVCKVVSLSQHDTDTKFFLDRDFEIDEELVTLAHSMTPGQILRYGETPKFSLLISFKKNTMPHLVMSAKALEQQEADKNHFIENNAPFDMFSLLYPEETKSTFESRREKMGMKAVKGRPRQNNDIYPDVVDIWESKELLNEPKITKFKVLKEKFPNDNYSILWRVLLEAEEYRMPDNTVVPASEADFGTPK